MKNAIFFFRHIGNHDIEWRKIGFYNLWAFSDWADYARSGLHWSTHHRCLVLRLMSHRSVKDITLLRLPGARKEGTSA